MSFLELPKPDFETGKKYLWKPAVLRGERMLGPNSNRIINAAYYPFRSEEVSDLVAEMKEVKRDADQADRLSWDQFDRNVYIFPHRVFPRASAFHQHDWMRDDFFSTLFMTDPRTAKLQMQMLSRFRECGEGDRGLPTTILFPGKRCWTFDDESNLNAIIWRAKLHKMGMDVKDPSYGGSEPWAKRWRWCRNHVGDGFYFNTGGYEKSWHDTVRFGDSDVVAYNQMFYALGTLAAWEMGLTDHIVVKQALETANKVVDKDGRLLLSSGLGHRDLSPLIADFLAQQLFGRQILTDRVVRATYEGMRQTDDGIPVVQTEDGYPLDPGMFRKPYIGGDYQNFADWPAFTTAARAAYENHGGQREMAVWRDIFIRLEQDKMAEYRCTTKEARDLYEGKSHNPTRENHMMNNVTFYIAKSVLSTDQLNFCLEPFSKKGNTVYSEAAQIS